MKDRHLVENLKKSIRINICQIKKIVLKNILQNYRKNIYRLSLLLEITTNAIKTFL